MRIKITQLVQTLSFLLISGVVLSGCVSQKSLQPVAKQNYENISAMSLNILTLITLYENSFNASSEALIGLRIAQFRKELIEVVGRATGSGPGPTASWDALFRNKKPYVYQRNEIISVIEQNPDNPDKGQLEALKKKHGWIYLTVKDDRNFTPQRAHKLAKDLRDLQLQSPSDFNSKAAVLIGEFDPKLNTYRRDIDAAKTILSELRQALTRQINFAESHSRAFLAYSQAEVKPGETISGILATEEMRNVLSELAKKHIEDETLREEVLNLMIALPGLIKPKD